MANERTSLFAACVSIRLQCAGFHDPQNDIQSSDFKIDVDCPGPWREEEEEKATSMAMTVPLRNPSI